MDSHPQAYSRTVSLSSEPEDFGFSEGPCKVMDFGYAFRPVDNVLYTPQEFSQATPLPPELSHGKRTAQPFKVDSWNLGRLVGLTLRITDV